MDSLVPFILDSLSISSPLTLKIESLHTISSIAKYPNHSIGKYAKKVVKKLESILEDKKRIVRLFTRNCINEWLSLN